VWAHHRPDLTINRAPHHDGAVVPADGHADNDDEACRSTRQHPPPAANTVRAAQDLLLLTGQERSVREAGAAAEHQLHLLGCRNSGCARERLT
jgi:hypothetical protein